MADSPGDPGGGGSVTPDSGVCSITPSDLVGYTGNALNRIAELEQRVAELETKIVQANQLSDLSGQIGWVDGITFMGVSGWTQTEYGSLIPPIGWSLMDSGLIPTISGSGMQLVYTDVDGNLFSLADSVAQDYASVANVAGSSTQSISRGITITTNSISGEFVTVEFTVSSNGIYWHGGHYTALHTAGGGIGDVRAAMTIKVNGVTKYGDNQSSPYNGTTEATGAFVSTATSGALSLTAGDVVRMDGSATYSFGTATTQNYDFSLLWFSSLGAA